jgi:hypothetical protein
MASDGNAKKLDPSLLGLAVAAFDLANEGESSTKPFQLSYLPCHGGRLTSKVHGRVTHDVCKEG